MDSETYNLLRRARRLQQELLNLGAISIEEQQVHLMLTKGIKVILADQYRAGAAQLFASLLKQAPKDLDAEAIATIEKAIRKVEEATIGDTAVARRDNAEIHDIFQRVAQAINDAIYEDYRERFGGRSYRAGDPARRSGELESFLRSGPLATKEDTDYGPEIVVSLAPAMNDPSVPHIFRLNYGTEALKGSEKPGERAPTFSVSLMPGMKTPPMKLEGQRRPGFSYPGRPFGKGFTLTVGGQGQIQLWGGKPEGGTRAFHTGQAITRPSRGIGPSYFIERGVAEGAQQLGPEFKHLLRLWRRRVG